MNALLQELDTAIKIRGIRKNVLREQVENMQNLPKISIVTPAYKSSSTIEQTIRSVVSQDYPNFEYIVVDGAGDDTAQILEKYVDNIHWWCSEPDDGQYDAVLKGFSRSTGDILCWINADDRLLPDALRIVGEVFADFPNVDWISSLLPGSYDAQGLYSGHSRISGFSKPAFLDGFFLPGTRRRGSWIQQESTFFRKSIFAALNDPFKGCRLAGDFALWCQLYETSDLVGITYPLAGFRHIAGQRSEDMSSYLHEARGALADLRKVEGYVVGGRLVETVARLSKYIRVGSKTRKRIGYDGEKIIKDRHRHPDASWKLEKYKFLI